MTKKKIVKKKKQKVINLTVEQKTEVVALVTTRFSKAAQFQKPLFNLFIEFYRLYRSIIDSKRQNYKGRAKLFIPYIWSTIETIMPRMVGAKPKIEAIPREPNDIANAESTSQLLDYQWDMMDMKKKIKLWVKQSLLYGVGVMKLTWSFKGEFGNVVQDRPEADVLDLFDFYIDPDATTIQDAAYIIHRAERNIDDLKANKNYIIPKELTVDVTQDGYKIQRDSILGLSKPKDPDKKKVELFEYWGLYDIEGDGIQKECLITLANRKYIIRATKNPYNHGQKPFVVLFDTQIPNEFWAVGEVEPLKSLQYELNDIRNQRMDNVTLILNRMWKVKKGANVDEDELISQAGGVVHTDDMGGIETIDTPDVTASAYNEETLVKSDMQQASGITDYAKGQGSNAVRGQQGMGNETATGIMLLQEAGNARFRYKLDNLEDSLRDFGKQLIALNQQYIDKSVTIRILGDGGPKWQSVSPTQIKGQYDIAVEAGSTQPMNKSMRRAEARELLATVAPFAELGANVKYFLQYLLKTYDLTETEKAFLPQSEGATRVPEEVAEKSGGASGAVLGGNVGNRGNASLKRLATPEIPVREESLPE